MSGGPGALIDYCRIIAGKIRRLITQSLLQFYRSMQKRFPATLWHGDPARRQIALTFDDGPHLRDTPGVLDVLERHRVRATFFLIGRAVLRTPPLVKDIHDRGHQIGIHCHRHIPFPWEDLQSLRGQLDATRSAIASLCGLSQEDSWDVRPPYGLFNLKLLGLFHEWKYRLVMWTCIPPHFLQPVGWSVKQIMEAAMPGLILVLHDGHGHGTLAVHILELILPRLKAQGFEFVTIEQMQERKNA
jgi:peptidoglycan/xylan/chitin deacetylase (PgdA/CDA1 family)